MCKMSIAGVAISQPMGRILDFHILFILLKQVLAILPAICRDTYEENIFSAAFHIGILFANYCL